MNMDLIANDDLDLRNACADIEHKARTLYAVASEMRAYLATPIDERDRYRFRSMIDALWMMTCDTSMH